MEIEELRKKYEKFGKKYSLPEFEEMLAVFDIGKIERDSGNLLKDIRNIMMEKVIHYVRLLELMLNPSQSTPVFMVFLREINKDDREIMNRVFKNFVFLELESFKLDIESNDESEANHLKAVYGSWNKSKDDLKKLVGIMERNWNSNQVRKDNKDYFG